MAHQWVASILLVVCVTIFYSLPSQAEARKDLLTSNFDEPLSPAKAPTQSFPNYCKISAECAHRIAVSKLINENLEDVTCCKSVVAIGEECLVKALEILHEINELGEDIFAWGEKNFMCILCGVPLLECVYCLACARWAWKRCLHTSGHESENWGCATAEEFEPVPRLCRIILAVYEDDLRSPLWAPPGGYRIDPDWVILRRTYKDTKGRAPPYLVYVDHENSDIVLAIRGLNLAKESDYAVLLDNKLGQRKFDGGYVHNGLLKAAGWVLDSECEVLKELLEKNPSYSLTFAGHSLGSGVAALLSMVVVQNRDRLGNISRNRVRCYAIAPARCMSLNLAVRYADVINSIVLQDDFLPRTATPLEDIFKSLFCLPCLLCLRCMRDTCIPEEKMLKDPRRLYAPGRLYHIVERKPFKLGRFPPVVRTAVPVDGRFEHIVLSCNATSDHAIIWIEREAQRALEMMLEKDKIMDIPPKQRMERQVTLAREHSEEHRAALQRAVRLSVPDAFSPSHYGTFEENDERDHSSDRSSGSGEGSLGSSKKSKHKESWDELIEHLFEKDDSGRMRFRKPEASDP